MTIEAVILGVVFIIAVAVVALVVLALRQSRHCRFIGTQVAETQVACQQLESRIDDVTARCQVEFDGVRGRLSRLEVGS